MNIVVSGANFNQNEADQTASININSNKNQAQTGKVKSFQSVIVSGADQQKSKLDQNTYESLMKQTQDVKAQIQASAADAKDNLKALFKRLSGADAVRIDEDGFNLNDATKEDMVDIVDRIKIELAAHGEKVYSAGAGPTNDQIKQVVGSTGLAEEIAGKMQDANLPVTDDNLQEVSDALNVTGQLDQLSENAKNYLVANQLSPSIDHVYKAEHMTEGTVAKSGQNISDQEWQQLLPQIKNVLTQAGLDASDQNLGNARTFLQLNIPVTAQNLSYKAELDALDMNQFTNQEKQMDLVNKMVHSMASGDSAIDTLLTDKTDIYTQVVDAINTLDQADYRHVQNLTESGQDFTIQNLKESIYHIGMSADADYVSWTAYVSDTATMVHQAGEAQTDATQDAESQNNINSQSTESNYMQLQQIRILMTAKAGLFLARQGVDLNTTSISELIQDLEQFNELGNLNIYDTESGQYVSEQQTDEYTQTSKIAVDLSEQDAINAKTNADSNMESGATDSLTAAQSRLATYQTVTQVRNALYEIEQAPDVSIGAVLKNADINPILSIATFAETGSSLRKRYEQAGQTYEAVGTSERKDLGDSIRKAIKASTDDILKEIGLESTQANRDAVRILAVNQMEMTESNINKVKEIHAQLNQMIDQMKPETVLSMIRDHVDPMNADIKEVNQYLAANNKETDDAAEKYSKFLYKLDQTNGITSEEREQFIGIYKMMNLFTKDAGAAVGALLKQNADITMSNLCTAYNNRKAAGIDATLDDTTGLAQIEGTINYYNNLFQSTGASMTPLSMKKVNEEEPIAQRSVDNFCEAVQEAYDSSEEEQYNTDYLNQIKEVVNEEQSAIRELNMAEQPVTVNNIMAMAHVSESGYFNGIMNADKSKKYIDHLDSKEELDQIYSDEEDEAKDQLDQALSANTDQTSDEIDRLRMKYKEIGLIKNLSMRHDYRIPYATKEGVGTIHLTLVQDHEESGRISISMQDEQLGNISVEAKVTKQDAYLYVQSDHNNTDSSDLQDKMTQISDNLKSEYGFENVSVQSGTVDQVKHITYDQAADSVASGDLYRIAKTIVVALTDIN